MYGLSYSYEPDYGGVGNNPGAVAGLGHQIQWRSNGATQTAIGSGIYTVGNLSLAGTTGVTLSGAGADISFTGTGPNLITTASGVNLALMPGGTGNVGIGTITPRAMLDISDSSNGGRVESLVLSNSGSGDNSATAIYMGYQSAGLGVYGARILQRGNPVS